MARLYWRFRARRPLLPGRAAGILLLVLGAGVAAEEVEEEVPGPPAKSAPRPFEIAKAKNPYRLPEGASRRGWELYLANDFAAAEKAFGEALAQAANDLEALEGLRGCLVSMGRYTEAQAVNLRMIAASSDSPLTHAFAARAMEALPFVESRARLAACLAETAARAAPPMRALLLDLCVTLHLQADRTDEARQALQGLGYVNRWLFVAGPFGFTDRNNPMARRFAPERPLKTLAFTDERGKPVTMRQDVPVPFRALNLGPLFPGARGIFYALTNLHSARDQEVLLLADAPDEARFFLRGLPILQPLDQQQYPRDPPLIKVRLLQGANPLLVKLPSAGELAVRVLSLDYAPAAGVSVQPLAPEALAAHEVVPLRGFLFSEPVCGALAEHFLKGMEKRPDERALGKGLSLYALAADGALSLAQALWLELAAQQENDQQAREALARRLMGSFPDAVGPLDLVAAVLASVGRAGGSSESRYLEEARQIREYALARVPASHQHLLGLYLFFEARELHDQALAKLKACAAAHPQSGLAQERLGATYQGKGMLALAQRQFELAAKLDEAFAPALARFLMQHGDRKRARAIETRLVELGLLARERQFDELLDRGELDAAEKIVAGQEQAFPDRLDQLQGLRVELALERGDVPAAYGLRRRLVARQPKNRAALVEAVDLALRLKRDDEARELLKKYLQEHASDFELRRRLAELEGRGGQQWWAPYDVSVRDIDTSQFTQEAYPRANHAWIVDFAVMKVLPDLSRESYTHIAQKVLNLDGINELSEVLVRAQRQDLCFIRTLNPDGTCYEPENVHNFNLAQSASFMKVGPGSILEHAYVEHEEADEVEPGLQTAFNFMALDSPRAVSRWVVLLPKERKFEIRKIRPELIDEKILPGPEGYVVYQWTNKKVEGIKLEPLMPTEADQEVIPLVFVESPDRPFRATGWLLRREVNFLPDAAAAEARALVQQFPGEEQGFRAIVEWVRASIQPGKEARTLEDVWALRSGDAGQMAQLALALCRAAGLPVHTALVNGTCLPGRMWVGKNAPRAWEPPVFADFGSAGRMLVLEQSSGPDVWLQFSGQPPRYYNVADFLDPQPGALALILGDEGARVKRVAADMLGEEPLSHRATVTLDERGAAGVRGALQFFGVLGGRLRQVLADPRRAQQVQQELVRRLWPQLEPGEIRAEHESRVERPLRLSYSGAITSLATPADRKSFFLPPFPMGASLSQLMGPAERVHDMIIKPALAERLTELDLSLSYEAPPGFGWIEVPDDVFLCTEFGFYLVDFNVKGRRLTCNRSYLMPAQRIAPDKYPKLMAFVRRVTETERQRVAYARLDYPGCGGLARAVLTQGYASHGGETAEKEEEPRAKASAGAPAP